MARTLVKIFYSLQVRVISSKNGPLSLIYAYLIIAVFDLVFLQQESPKGPFLEGVRLT